MGAPEQKRCSHCRDVYLWWWGSTPYTNDPDNNSDYCPECHKAIRLALEAIPKKRRTLYVATDKFTCMDLDPHTPEPTELPPKVDREFVVSPMIQMARRSDLLTKFRMQTSEPESLADLREIDDEDFVQNIEDAVTRAGEGGEGVIDRSSPGAAPKKSTSLKHTRDYAGGYGKKTLAVQPLPEGCLPKYDTDLNIDSALKLPGATYSVQVESGLFDMLDPWNKHKAGHVERDGVTYYYEWWTRTGKAAGTVKVLMEEIIATGEIVGPWQGPRR